jgi:hypothetical protein
MHLANKAKKISALQRFKNKRKQAKRSKIQRRTSRTKTRKKWQRMRVTVISEKCLRTRQAQETP